MLDDKEGIVDNHGTQGYPVVVIPNDMLQMRSSDATEDTKKDKSRRGEVNSSVAEYLSRMQGTPLPLSLHHFLKFSADTIKREADIESSPLSSQDMGGLLEIAADPHELLIENGEGGKRKKKYKKKPPKPKKPRPGQVHIATALDGTTLFCCPECNMAYPDKDMLEQHLIGHKIERRFICDICGAGLKRKEHLERHKLGHNPERPFVCSICCKGKIPTEVPIEFYKQTL
ncbi:zinc finger protein 281-like [Diaphorina citri]|uniref:Zinc finger protein 281-like n=1 Tax=Diaphorina citri TaxID=121845 RepID=A0A3Q0ISD5_DIACI|nr:zinc finger protein 281-like [Diaphorina citri]